MSQATSKYFVSEPMAGSQNFDNILELGQRLIHELDMDDTADTLGRWMVHYISELMISAKAETGEVRIKRDACATAVLNLWAHRSVLSDGNRPFEGFEPVFRTLASLDPDNTLPRYFRRAPWSETSENEKPEIKKWLDTAAGIDHTARILIRHCLSLVVENLEAGSNEWVRLSEAVGVNDDDIQLVRFVISDASEITNNSPAEDRKKKLQDLKDRLDGFAAFSQLLASDLQARLNSEPDSTLPAL